MTPHHRMYHKDSGFTLLEVVLALSIGTIGVLITAQSFLLIFTTRSYQEAMTVIGEESRYIFLVLGTEVRKVDTVTYPGPGDTGTSLTLEEASSTITYSLADETIWESSDGGMPSRISAPEVRVTGLSFQHLHPGDAPLVRMTISLSAGDDDTTTERLYEDTFETSVAIRR